MEDLIMYAQSKGSNLSGMSDHDFIHMLKKFMLDYKEESVEQPKHYHGEEHEYMNPLHHKEHMDTHEAKAIVADMWHENKGHKYVGEKYSMERAKEIYEKNKLMLGPDVTMVDVYVAINAQYHDYCQLFTSWFGSAMDKYIIDSALVFWFKDVDYDKGSKVYHYFKD